MSHRHPPVGDFATDFDHTDAAWVADPYPIWDDLRQRCPVARYPDFELSDPAAVTWSAGQVRGPRALPVTIR